MLERNHSTISHTIVGSILCVYSSQSVFAPIHGLTILISCLNLVWPWENSVCLYVHNFVRYLVFFLIGIGVTFAFPPGFSTLSEYPTHDYLLSIAMPSTPSVQHQSYFKEERNIVLKQYNEQHQPWTSALMMSTMATVCSVPRDPAPRIEHHRKKNKGEEGRNQLHPVLTNEGYQFSLPSFGLASTRFPPYHMAQEITVEANHC